MKSAGVAVAKCRSHFVTVDCITIEPAVVHGGALT
jgi:hypothetical protein